MYQVIIFSVGNEEYALNLNEVSSILEYEKITPMPMTQKEISGVINVRGEIFTVIDMGKVIGSEVVNTGSEIILLDDERKIGLHVQKTNNVYTVRDEDINDRHNLVSKNNVNIVKNIINANGIKFEVSKDLILASILG